MHSAIKGLAQNKKHCICCETLIQNRVKICTEQHEDYVILCLSSGKHGFHVENMGLSGKHGFQIIAKSGGLFCLEVKLKPNLETTSW